MSQVKFTLFFSALVNNFSIFFFIHKTLKKFLIFFSGRSWSGLQSKVLRIKAIQRQLSFVCCFNKCFTKSVNVLLFLYSEVFFGVFLIQESQVEKSFFKKSIEGSKRGKNDARQKSILLKLLVKLRENTCKHHTGLGEVIASHMVSQLKRFIIILLFYVMRL